MPQRVRLVLIGVFALLLAVFAGVWLAAFNAAGDSKLTVDPSAPYAGFVRPPGSGTPAFSLVNQDGDRVAPPTHGPAVYAFIYSHCPDTCPLEVAQIRGAMDALGHDVPVYGISVDPANDTPDSARAFLIKQHMTGRMDFLMGSRPELEPIWKAFGIAPQTGSEEHSAGIVIVDSRGRQRIGFPASQLSVDGLEHDLRKLGA